MCGYYYLSSIYLLFPDAFNGVDGTLLELLCPFVLHELAEEADKLVDAPLDSAASSEAENQSVVVVACGSRVDGPLAASGCARARACGARGCDQGAVKVVVSAEHRQEVGERLVAENGDGLLLLELESELRSQEEHEVALEDVVSVEKHEAEDEKRDAALDEARRGSREVLAVDAGGGGGGGAASAASVFAAVHRPQRLADGLCVFGHERVVERPQRGRKSVHKDELVGGGTLVRLDGSLLVLGAVGAAGAAGTIGRRPGCRRRRLLRRQLHDLVVEHVRHEHRERRQHRLLELQP